MANEILPAGIGDLITDQVLATEFLFLLADRDASFLGHPALMYAMGNAPNSTVIRVPHLGLLGYDLLSATTPGSEVANTALTDGSTDVTVAMRAKRYEVDDLAQYIAAGKLDAPMFARDLAASYTQTQISLTANVADDFTSTAGSTGVNLAWSDILVAKGTLLVAKASGAMCSLLHHQQWSDLETDALSLGVQPTETNMGIVDTQLQAYKGRYFGIDFYSSAHVPTANAAADRAGSVFTRGAIAWADVPVSTNGDPNIASLGRARLEYARQGTKLSTAWMFSYASGVSKAIDGAGVSVISDA